MCWHIQYFTILMGLQSQESNYHPSSNPHQPLVCSVTKGVPTPLVGGVTRWHMRSKSIFTYLVSNGSLLTYAKIRWHKSEASRVRSRLGRACLADIKILFSNPCLGLNLYHKPTSLVWGRGRLKPAATGIELPCSCIVSAVNCAVSVLLAQKLITA